MSRDQEGTRVDLGEDLLEPTRTLQVPPKKAIAPAPAFDPQDQLASVEIYISEGFLDDAKKILHKLWNIPEANAYKKNIRKYLDEIQQKELEQILKTKQKKKEKSVPQPPAEDPDDILEKLEADLGIQSEQESSFSIQAIGSHLNEKEMLDLAVGFFEMGLPHQSKDLLLRSVTANPLDIESLCLFSEVMLALNDPFPAIESSRAALADADIGDSEKIHLMYLMGRLREMMKSVADATFWYQRVKALDENYRDTSERLRRLIR